LADNIIDIISFEIDKIEKKQLKENGRDEWN